MEELKVESAALYQARLVGEAERGALVLTATGRLARRILHCHRVPHASGGPGGWPGLQVQSLGAWVMRSHAALWPETRTLGRAASLRLWHEATSAVASPEGLTPGPSLYGELQRILDQLMEQGASPTSGASGHALSDWRRTVTGRFLKLAGREGFHQRAQPFAALCAAAGEGRLAVPKRAVLAGFDAPSPLEEDLFAALSGPAQVARLTSAAEDVAPPPVQVFGTAMQECRAACAAVLDAWNEGRTALGVVYLDPSYYGLLKRCFDELAGEGPRPDLSREIRYNLAGGLPLDAHPLFLTALLPLRCAAESTPAPLLASLLCSPYAGAGAKRAEQVRDALYASSAPLALASCLDALGRRNLPVASLRNLANLGTAPLAKWIEVLRACWKDLGFVAFEADSRDADAIARRHLEEVAHAAAGEAGSVEVGAEGALAWITACADGLQVAEPSPETAGIQVLGLGEARGLAFEEVWVVGVNGDTLPKPALDTPLLHPVERRALPGGTPESRWEEARRDLAMLLASAPAVHLSRPWATEDEALVPPCPLAADERRENGEVEVRTVDLWTTPPAPWMRARWLRDSLLASREGETPALEEERAGFRLSGEWRVTQLGDLVACPFRFFAGPVAGLVPLQQAAEGMDPLERGSALHDVLAAFAEGLREHAPHWSQDEAAEGEAREEALAWLGQIVDGELAHYPKSVFWEVERLRWMGDAEAGTPGILPAWLDLELERARAGWSFAATEADFHGLALGPITLRGRVDRVDRHPVEGLAVWDYKSGRAPTAGQVVERSEEPQLPAYLLALQRGLLKDFEAEKAPLQAGYIPLRKPGEVAVRPLRAGSRSVDWTQVLPQWVQAMEARMEGGAQGFFPADPRPGVGSPFTKRGGACQYCDYYDLCGRFDGSADAESEDESAEEDTP